MFKNQMHILIIQKYLTFKGKIIFLYGCAPSLDSKLLLEIRDHVYLDEYPKSPLCLSQSHNFGSLYVYKNSMSPTISFPLLLLILSKLN